MVVSEKMGHKNLKIFIKRENLDLLDKIQTFIEWLNLSPDFRWFTDMVLADQDKSPKILMTKKMGRQTGFEPATPGTTNQCSNQLSYYRHKRSS